jgi:CRISPR-associated exonuclease Cas4
MQDELKINGTLIWYYTVCKREVWLISRNLIADQDNQLIEIGRIVHENSYLRDKKEITIGNIKIDILKRENGEFIVGEIKKSSKFKYAARMQLLYYLSILKEAGLNVRGELFFPEERKREEVILSSDSLSELEAMKRDILRIVYLEKPPKPTKISFCKNCAYKEFCWS